MRIALVGAVESSRVAFEALVEAGIETLMLMTLPAAKLSRHSDGVDLRPWAERTGTTVAETTNVNSEESLATLERFQPDYVFVVGWSQICRRPFLESASKGIIGYHPALLPENRGRAVIPWTILQGQESTGSTLFWMDEGMDSGDILAQERFAVSSDETATSLYEKHMVSLSGLMAASIDSFQRGDAPRHAQDHAGATYCSQRRPEDGKIDWRLPAPEVWRLVRATTRPYPGAFTAFGDDRMVVWSADVEPDAPWWGVPGQVQIVDESGALVQCGNRTHLRLKQVQLGSGQPTRSHEVLARQDRLD